MKGIKWESWVGGGSVRVDSDPRQTWSTWLRDVELHQGCLPCPDLEFPGPRRALEELEEQVRLAKGFVVRTELALREFKRNCRR